MERPLLIELDNLITRLVAQQPLTDRDVKLVDTPKATGFCVSSQIANTVNQVWMLISKLPLQPYWQSISWLLVNSRQANTKVMAFTNLKNRISSDWPIFPQDRKNGLKSFVVNSVNEMVEDELKQQVLRAANICLVAILRFERDNLFKDFINHLKQQGFKETSRKVLNHLFILRLIIEEGFQSQDLDKKNQFKNIVEDDMRVILQILCSCLKTQNQDRMAIIPKCLQTLQLTLEYIPAFEIFNCSLIELLISMLAAPEFHDKIFQCFVQIFNFKEKGGSKSYHSKIVKKLLIIIEAFLQHFQRVHAKSCDKQSESTVQSFKSRTKKSKKQSKSIYRELLTILSLFLDRYTPHMDDMDRQSDFQIEGGQTKLYFSKDLYQYLAKIYYRLIVFFQIYVKEQIDFNLIQTNDDQLQQQIRLIISIKHMLTVFLKLRLQTHIQMQPIIEWAVLKLTPLCQTFQRYYIQMQLIQSQFQILTETIKFSKEYQQEYKHLMAIIIKDQYFRKIYVDIIYDRLENTDYVQVRHMPESIRNNMENIRPKELSQYHSSPNIAQSINTINRITWSIVYAYEADEESASKINVSEIITELTMNTKVEKFDLSIRKCCSFNAKYLSQAYNPNAPIKPFQVLIATLEGNQNDLVHEFVLIIISKILLNTHFDYRSCSLQDAQTIIGITQALQAKSLHGDELIKIYSGIYHLLQVHIQQLGNQKLLATRTREILDLLIGSQIKGLTAYSQTNAVNQSLQLNAAISLMIKLQEINMHLIKYYQKHEKVSEKMPKGYYWLLKTHISYVIEFIRQFEYKFELFSEQLRTAVKEYFEIKILFAFKELFIKLHTDYIQLYQIKLKIQMNDPNKPSQKAIMQSAEKVKFILITDTYLSKDFEKQIKFKSKQFLAFSLRLYKFLILINHPQRNLVINRSIGNVTRVLKNWNEDFQVLNAKIGYWKEVIEICVFYLDKNNVAELINMLKSIDDEKNSALVCNIEGFIEIYELLMEHIFEQCENQELKGAVLWSNYCGLFLAIFESLFANIIQHPQIFAKLSKLFHMQLLMSDKLLYSFHQGSTKRQNTEILFILVQDHIKKVINGQQQIDQYLKVPQHQLDHDLKFQAIFRERNLDNFTSCLNSYVQYMRSLSFVSEQFLNKRVHD